jgi:hypothetical protein
MLHFYFVLSLMLLPLFIPAACSQNLELPAGTAVKVLLNEPVNTWPLSEGQTLMCKGYEGVRVQGKTVIAHGTPAHARILEVEVTRKKQVKSVTVQVMDILATDGQSVRLEGAPIQIQVTEDANGIGFLLMARVAESIQIGQ